MSDPWAPPTSPAPLPGWAAAAPPRRRHRAAWALGAVITLTLVAALAAVLTLDRSVRDSPSDAFDRWVAAAGSGRAADIRAAVAPSQRSLVGEGDPTGTGLARVELRVSGRVHFDSSPLSPDEAVARLARTGARICGPDGRCQEVSGSGPDGTVLVVREAGRWWVVARPLQRPNPAYWR